jgi:heat shock protein HslJ
LNGILGGVSKCHPSAETDAMHKLLKLVTATLTLAPMLGALSAMASNDLDNTAWTLAELPGHPALTDRPATLRFSEGRAQGTDGCNRYTAPYEAIEGSFRVSGSIAGTRMACPEPVMNQAEAFLAALTKARDARVEDGGLVLVDDAGTVLAAFAAHNQVLAGTTWQVTGYNNGKQAVVSVLHDTKLTLTFSPEGKVAGSAGCNRFTGTYSVDSEKVTIANLAATRKLCTGPDKVMEQELAFLEALGATAVARIEGDRLELRSAVGALLVSASR